jgi:hypothetical protein
LNTFYLGEDWGKRLKICRRKTPRTLRAALGKAVKWKVLKENPAMFADGPRQEKVEQKVLSADKVALSLNEINNTDYKRNYRIC